MEWINHDLPAEKSIPKINPAHIKPLVPVLHIEVASMGRKLVGLKIRGANPTICTSAETRGGWAKMLEYGLDRGLTFGQLWLWIRTLLVEMPAIAVHR